MEGEKQCQLSTHCEPCTTVAAIYMCISIYILEMRKMSLSGPLPLPTPSRWQS